MECSCEKCLMALRFPPESGDAMPKVNVKDKRKQQLIDANITSIARRGLADTTIAHVCDGAKMSRGIVNFYFTSKEKMMQETLVYLVNEQSVCWQEAVAARRAQTQEPLALVEAMLRSLLGDRLCSVRRLSAWNAFIGHAGTHTGYAKLIRQADEQFIKQAKSLFQQTGIKDKTAEKYAQQLLALIRGHHVMSFLNTQASRPSSYSDHWAGLLQGWGEAAQRTPAQTAPATKPKKPAAQAVLPGQLAFNDFFAQR